MLTVCCSLCCSLCGNDCVLFAMGYSAGPGAEDVCRVMALQAAERDRRRATRGESVDWFSQHPLFAKIDFDKLRERGRTMAHQSPKHHKHSIASLAAKSRKASLASGDPSLDGDSMLASLSLKFVPVSVCWAWVGVGVCACVGICCVCGIVIAFA